MSQGLSWQVKSTGAEKESRTTSAVEDTQQRRRVVATRRIGGSGEQGKMLRSG